MKRLMSLILLGGLSAAAFVVGPALPSHASWVSEYCNTSQYADYNVRRKDVQPYAMVAVGEGYEWGGGCWNDNNRDDTPNQPDSNGEGPDCSGLVFKTWELQNNGGGLFTYHDRMQFDHGPYASYDFHSPVDTDPFYGVPKSRSSMQYMDAFAKNGHVALLSSKDEPNSQSDYVYEAYTDDAGVLQSIRQYRYDSDYTGARREGWTPDCWPNCGGPDQSLIVVG